MTRLAEVISTVRRRRAWSDEEKVAILLPRSARAALFAQVD
jgi:hypothetical protein